MLENIIIENTEGELENLVFNADISDDEILQAMKHLKRESLVDLSTYFQNFFMDYRYFIASSS